ncbi:BTB/POZ protein [Tuber indicum]|nr:BTB/POZ protein [Tuber indicum]
MGPLTLRKKVMIKPIVTPEIVVRHFEFLSSYSEEMTEVELPTRISEIRKAYEYLEEKLPAFTIQTSVLIWLNIWNEDVAGMTLETFQNSWSCTKNLWLNSNCGYDSGESKCVHSFLGRFHPLLLHAGVPEVIPPRKITKLPRTQSSTLGDLHDLREQEVLCDVTITAPPQTFKAHKIVLASASMYFRAMFTSTCFESSATKVPLQDDPATIKVLLDYIYTNEFIEPPYEEDVTRQLESLIDQLEKSQKWFLSSFQDSMEVYLMDPHWIRPETVKFILSSSEMCRAEQLASVCREYIEVNQAIVARESPSEEEESLG